MEDDDLDEIEEEEEEEEERAAGSAPRRDSEEGDGRQLLPNDADDSYEDNIGLVVRS